MPLFCSLGLHRAAPDEVWNKGWYFSRCERCGSDLVRTPSGKWHVPKGRKVVWRSRTPRGRKPDLPGERAQD